MFYKHIFKHLKFISAIPIVIVAISIFYLSHQAQLPQIYLLSTFEDKLQHFLAYFVFGLTLQIHLKFYKLTYFKFIFITIIFGLFYGASDEFHQSFVQGRFAEFNDWIADAIGILFSLFFSKLIDKTYKKIILKSE